jgi:TetR/AcrR family transcriptional regulator, ethionamide resistance regulator
MARSADRSADPTPPARGGRRRGPSKGDLKEEAILHTAWQLLATKPAASITVEELAKGAGISRPTFYFYFDSRDAVLRALAEVVTRVLDDVVGDFIGDEEHEPGERIRHSVAAYLEGWHEHGPVLRAMVVPYETDPEVKSFWDGVASRRQGRVVEAIERERAAGRALPAPPTADLLASTLFAMLWRAGYEASLRGRDPRADRALVEALTTVCVRALYGTGG